MADTWTATSSIRETRRQDGRILALPMEDNVTVYKGDLVRLNAAGFATSTSAPAAGDVFAGVAYETIDNTTTGHAQGGKKVRVETTGVHSFKKSVPAATDRGVTVYGGASDATNDQQTVYDSQGTHAVVVGKVVDYLDPDTGAASTTEERVLIQPFGAAAS